MCPPQVSVYEDWKRHEASDFLPTDRQLTVVSAVWAALESNLFYTDEVRDYCAKTLGVTSEQAQVGAGRVEGGNFGMDCYYARDYIKAQRRNEAETIAFDRLRPVVGQKLGTLMFNDFKRNTGVTVVALLDEGKSIKISGKRGAYSVEMICTAMNIINAMDRAAERGLRKGGFTAFFATKPCH